MVCIGQAMPFLPRAESAWGRYIGALCALLSAPVVQAQSFPALRLSESLSIAAPQVEPPSPVSTQESGAQRHTVKATGSLSLGYASSDRLLSGESDLLIPRARLKIVHGIAPGIYWRYEADATSRRANGNDDAFVLREAYLNYREDRFDLRAGLQSIPWGRADVINPSDNLTPSNYTWLTLNDAEQRIGTAAIQVGYQFEYGKLTAISLPLFRPSKVPLGDTQGLTVREAEPEALRSDFALRWERQSSGPEWSVSWFHGHSLRPNLVPAADLPTSGVIELQHPRVEVLGADFAAPWRSIIFRGEAAYTRAQDCCDVAGVEFQKSDNLFAVLGVETAFSDGWRAVVQAFHKKNFEKSEQESGPSPVAEIAYASNVLNDELRSDYTGLSVGIYPTALGDRVKTNIDVAWIAQTNDYAIRPRLIYQLQDSLSLNLAADWYGGNREGPLGKLRDNSLVLTEVQWRFVWQRK